MYRDLIIKLKFGRMFAFDTHVFRAALWVFMVLGLIYYSGVKGQNR